jgi:aspartyl-tRNA(Asn)/glutamyl-tRNA(Gln) amidotransferase subunit A
MAYLRITSAACVPLFEPYVRTGQAGAEVLRRFELGVALRANGTKLVEAYAVRRRLAAQVRAVLTRCDVLLCPTMPTTAPLLFEEIPGLLGVHAEDLADPMHAPYTDCWAVLANLAGVPSLSFPAGCSSTDGMPVGMMLCGPRGCDATLLGLVAALETVGLAQR